MSGSNLRSAVVGGIAGAFFASATIAVAGSGIGGVFNLGQQNSVNGQIKKKIFFFFFFF